MSVTADQKATIDEIVCIFETGRRPTPAAYATVSLDVNGDGAGITYGAHQATRGTLDAILAEYKLRAGPYSGEIDRVLAGRHASDSAGAKPGSAPEWIEDLMPVLRAAGYDSVMQQVQRDVFEARYWRPACTQVEALGLKTALSYLALYDLAIHSGIDPARPMSTSSRLYDLRSRFRAVPPVYGGEEQTWIRELLAARRAWLESVPRLVPTAKRVIELQRLVAESRWDLIKPFLVYGIAVF